MAKKRTYKLRVKESEAIEALLQEPTITAAAKRLGVNRSTLHRWMNRPDFAAKMAAARRGEELDEERERRDARRDPRRWYERGNTSSTRKLLKAIHERACKLFPGFDPSDPRLLLSVLTSNDQKLLRLRRKALAEGVIV